MSNTDKLQEIKRELEIQLEDELGLSDKWKDGTYIYCLTRCKESFHVGTMTLDDFIEIDNDFLQQVLERAMLVVSPLISQLEQAQMDKEEFEAKLEDTNIELDRLNKVIYYMGVELQQAQAENEQLKADKQKLVEELQNSRFSLLFIKDYPKESWGEDDIERWSDKIDDAVYSINKVLNEVKGT